jgi:hypothetical protein
VDIVTRLVIKKVGDREALRALESLDKTGRQIVENVANATGKAMGDIANAYVTGGKAMQGALQSVSEGWKQQQQEMAATGRAAEALEMRQAHSIATATRGLEMIGRTGQLTGRSLDAVVGQISAMAFSFGPTGQIVAAIGITTAAVIELFMRTAKEARKLREETEKEFARIAHMDVAQQGDEASRLFSGDRFAERKVDRLSIPQMKARMAALQAALPKGDLTVLESQMGSLLAMPASSPLHKTGEAIKELDDLDKELDKRENILRRITGLNGSMAYAGKKAADVDQWSFLADDAKEAERAAKKAAAAAEAAEKAMHRLNIANTKVDAELAVIHTKAKQAGEAANAAAIEQGLVGFQSNLKLKFEIFNAPFEAAAKEFDKAVDALAKHMHDVLGQVLGDGLAKGFEAAFSGKGIAGAFSTLTATVLSGLGDFLEKLGAGMVITGTWLTAFANAMKSLQGPAAIAAGVGLIAAGAAMKAIAGSFGGASGGSGGRGYGSSSSLATVIDRGVINPSNYSSVRGADVQQRPQINNYNTILGVNDPQLPRFFDEVNRKSMQRGSLAGA